VARPVGAVIETIETIYRVDGDEQAWLQRIADALEPAMSRGMGLYAFTYDLAEAPVRVHTAVEHRPAFAAKSVMGIVAGSERAITGECSYDELWRRCCFASSASVTSFEDASARSLGVRDMLAMNAIDAAGTGVFVGAPHAARRDVSAGEARLWLRVTGHLTAALRLRRRLGAAPAAVLSVTGRVEDADAVARLSAHREALRDAVARIERARGSLRRDDDAASSLWRPLVKERYTLVDRFEADGRRYIVAYDNRPAVTLDLLTDREREIVEAIACGESSKQVAYALGLSDSTVRVLIARAAKRLGLTTRRELVAFYRLHAQRD